MPDLHTDAVHAFWDSYDRRTLYRVIVALEAMETWTVDHEPEVELALLELGRAMDMAHNIDFSGKEAILIRVLANTKAGRAMRILQAIDMVKPGTAAQLLMYAEEASEDRNGQVGDRHAKVFLKRNLIFERLQLLSRVFAPQRIALVIKALEQWQETL